MLGPRAADRLKHLLVHLACSLSFAIAITIQSNCEHESSTKPGLNKVCSLESQGLRRSVVEERCIDEQLIYAQQGWCI